MRRCVLLACLLLAACGAAPPADTPSRAADPPMVALAPMKSFAAPRPVPPQRANREILRDFLDLSFALESGRALPVLTRFEEPIRVRVTGRPPPTLMPDLARLMQRLRREAGIDIAAARGTAANVTIEAVSHSRIRRHLPRAACFVVPNISRLSQYPAVRRSAVTDWTRMTTRRKIAIFLPADASPQEVRDCLHEELAQAIGPLNDLYRLPDSVFNDDNVHAVLTGFDMLILRATYAPELRSGMTRAQVAERLPAILRRLNPGGEGRATRHAQTTPRAWIDAMETALGPGQRAARRLAAAQEALRIARAAGWRDHREAFSHYAMGRILQAANPEAAQRHFVIADRLYAAMPGTRLHRAFTAAQLAGYQIAKGDGEAALALVMPHLGTAERHENAALLATLMMLRAEALALTGRPAEARAVRLDSLGWARYGYGADWMARATLRGVAVLDPAPKPNG